MIPATGRSVQPWGCVSQGRILCGQGSAFIPEGCNEGSQAILPGLATNSHPSRRVPYDSGPTRCSRAGCSAGNDSDSFSLYETRSFFARTSGNKLPGYHHPVTYGDTATPAPNTRLPDHV